MWLFCQQAQHALRPTHHDQNDVRQGIHSVSEHTVPVLVGIQQPLLVKFMAELQDTSTEPADTSKGRVVVDAMEHVMSHLEWHKDTFRELMRIKQCRLRRQLTALKVKPGELEALLTVSAKPAGGSCETGTIVRLAAPTLAEMLGLTYPRWLYVKRLLLEPPKPSKRELMSQRRQYMAAEVTSRAVLLEQTGMSLAARAHQANLRAFGKVFSASSLRQTYRDEGVGFKATRVVKAGSQTPKAQLNRQLQFREMKGRVLHWLDQGRELVSVDECCFTWRGHTKNEWSPLKQNLELTQIAAQCNTQCVACVGATSISRGRELFEYRHRSFNALHFKGFVERLHQRMQGRPYFLFLDNATIHRAGVVKDRCRQLGVKVVFNVSYCPEYQGIERVWAIAKRHFKRSGTQQLMYGLKRDLTAEAKAAVDLVTDEQMMRCTRHGLNVVKKIQLPGEAAD